LLNVKSGNKQCFIHCILAALFPACRKQNRISVYKKHLKYIDMSRLQFPMKINKIKYFEYRNNISVNIFGFQKQLFPLYKSKSKLNGKQSKTIVDLLLYNSHYFLITDLNKALGDKNKNVFCRNCLCGFYRKSTLQSHIKICESFEAQKLSLPENLEINFSSYEKTFKSPFVLYCDFECITSKLSYNLPDSTKSFTTEIELHEPICFAIIVTDLNNDIVYSTYYDGENVINTFIAKIKMLSDIILNKMKRNIPMNEKPSLIEAKICFICKKFFKTTDIVCRDHCHFSGQFRGFAHRGCNLNYKPNFYIPVVIHNLSGYDSHIILKHLSNTLIQKINIIPMNTQKMLSFTLDNLKFIDSFLFLNSSLQTLTENLQNSNYPFKAFNDFFSRYKNRNLLQQKGVFPYSYFKSKSVLEETALPAKEFFFNNLTNSNITEKEYELAENVWKSFKCRTFRDYLKLYQFSDVVLLAEVFNTFRHLALSFYELDPVNFFSTPDLTWHAGLKFTNIKLQLLPDIDMYLMVEKGMRGGLTVIGKRYACANNPYIIETFKQLNLKNYILAIDCNNLYGFAMQQSLPVGDFRWLSKDEIKDIDINHLSSYSPVGYIFDVDLEYPECLHKKHNDLPLAADHLIIKNEMLSQYQKDLLDQHNIKFLAHNKKLAPNFYEKKNYIVYCENLKYYVKNGLILKKINRVLAFARTPWLKPYIEFNNEKRKQAIAEFDKSFFKLLNNAFFGKTCQNIRKRVNMKAALNENTCKKYLASPALEYFESINKNLTLCKLKKTIWY